MEFIEVAPGSTVVGVYWVDTQGDQREPLFYQHVMTRDGRIAHIQDYRKREPALRAAAAA